MPTNLKHIIEDLNRKEEQAKDLSLARRLGEELSISIQQEYFASGMSVESGHLIEALGHVGQPEATANGWTIGVVGPGSKIRAGAAPRGTIGAFLRWYGQQAKKNGWPNYRIRGGVPSRLAWRMLSSFQKEELLRQRQAGRFGGESAIAAGKVPYLLPQERGKESASITGRGFEKRGLEKWRTRVPKILEEHFSASR